MSYMFPRLHPSRPDQHGRLEATFTDNRKNDGSDCYNIQNITSNLENDPLTRAHWKQQIAGWLPLTGLIPVSISLWAGYEQLVVLRNWTDDATTTLPYMSKPRWLDARVDGMAAIVVCSIVPILTSALTAVKTFPALLRPWRPRLRLLGGVVPSVDVILTVCGEPLDVIQDTVRAVLHLDYPASRFRVLVSDDGNSEALCSWVKTLHGRHSNLWYTARGRRAGQGFKAGNLNHAIEILSHLDGSRCADFVAGIDADMLVEPRWLRAVLPHLLRDQKMGVVCPAQSFYNMPTDDPLHQGQLWEYQLLEIMRDRAGSAWNNGSGWVLRRNAILDIGGFPTKGLTEDVYSSVLMLSRGWSTAYLPEALQYGLVPDSHAAHVKQFERWHIGGCQIALNMRFGLDARLTRHMSLSQRLHTFCYGLEQFINPITLSAALTVTIFWLVATDTPLVFAASPEDLRFLLRLRCLATFSAWLLDVQGSLIAGYGATVRARATSLSLVHHHLLAMIRLWILPKSWGGGQLHFTPTGSIRNALFERESLKRKPLFARLHQTVTIGHVWPVPVVLLLIVFGVGRRSVWILRSNVLSFHEKKMALLTHVFWPPPLWYELALAFWIPMRYIFWPPSVPPRADHLEDSTPGGHRCLRPAMKTRSHSVRMTKYPLLHSLSIVYAIVLWAGTFIY